MQEAAGLAPPVNSKQGYLTTPLIGLEALA